MLAALCLQIPLHAQSVFINDVSLTGIGSSLQPPANPDDLIQVVNTVPPGAFGVQGVFESAKVADVGMAPFAIQNGTALNYVLNGRLGEQLNTTLLSFNMESAGSDATITLDNSYISAYSQSIEVYDDFNLSGVAGPAEYTTTASVSGDLSISGIYVTFEGPNELSWAIGFENDVTLTFSDGSVITGDEMVVLTSCPSGENGIDFKSFVLMAENTYSPMTLNELLVKYNTPVVTTVSAAGGDPGDVITIVGDYLDEVVSVSFINSLLPEVEAVASYHLTGDNALSVTIPEANDANTMVLRTFFGMETTYPFDVNPICGIPQQLFHYIDRTGEGIAAELSWSEVGNASQYEVRYRPVGGSWTTLLNTGNTMTITGLTMNQEYEWQVKALCYNGATENFSTSYFFTTAYTDVVMVREEVFEGIQQWLEIDPADEVDLFDFLDNNTPVTDGDLETFGEGFFTSSDGTDPSFGTGCFCKQIQIAQNAQGLANNGIQVEPSGGGHNDMPVDVHPPLNNEQDDTKGRRRHAERIIYKAHGPAVFMQHERYGHRKSLDEKVFALHTGQVAPNFSKLSITYICLKSNVQSVSCGCVKEVDVDVRYESFHALQARRSEHSSAVKSRTEEYAFVYAREQPSNNSQLLFAGYSAYEATNQVSWNPDAFINLVDLAEIIAKTILVGTVTADDITATADVLTSMIGTPFQIKQASQGGNSGVAIGNKITLQLKPNTTLTVALHAEGEMGTYGKGNGKSRWLALAEIHSNYRISAVIEPRPVITEPWCCIKSLAMWDSYSMGWLGKSGEELRASIGEHLTTYHPAPDWPGFPYTNNYGAYYLDLDEDKYRRWHLARAVNTCPPYQDPPAGWNWVLAYGGKTDPSAPETASTGEMAAFAWYPNPSSGAFNLALRNLELGENDKVMVYNSQGELILQQQLQGNTELDLSAQPAGLYLLHMEIGGETIPTSVVVQ